MDIQDFLQTTLKSANTDWKKTKVFQVPKVEEVVSKTEFAPRFNPPLENWVGPAGKTVTLACKVRYRDRELTIYESNWSW